MGLIIRIRPEAGGFVAECVDFGVVSQGETEAEARANLDTAVAQFLESADSAEIASRMHVNIEDLQGRRRRHVLDAAPSTRSAINRPNSAS